MSETKKQNHKLLNDLKQNAQMGISAINAILQKSDNDAINKDLSESLHKLRAVEAEIKKEMKIRNITEEKASALGELGLKASVNMNMMMNKAPTHIAQMVMKGNNMGIIDATRSMHNNKSADTSLKALAEKLIQVEENSSETIKSYL